ncbi:SurA N-terminal domain-containing protein [Geodermatophilus sp. DSM 44513]|uniref:SurA N-terminal domain-containing protein n=1 Tax=Geodermatophilus sp. DSM 44513 TaxID=1528104 RepID=UPI001AA13921|nr:SurA N-terminal domain-containing protein [Geodermatophilus sp. DSM 44513]WNV76409.1 SurA N-terminal domain-containing protein [Geodermatophilus sp. DSM 44513]
MHTPRLTASLAVGLVALAGVAGCRSDPGVAAYVGEEQVTVGELQTALDSRLEDPALAQAAAGREDEFTRLVLTRLVNAEVYDLVAQRYGVTADDADVRARLDELLAGEDPEAVYAQAASQGVARADVFETIRQQLLRQRLAESEGLVEGVTEEQLRAAYDEALPSLSQARVGYVNVPDQAAADAAVAALQADPAAYPAIAAQYPGDATLAEVTPVAPADLPPQLADTVAAAAPDTATSLTAPELPGVLVVFVGQPVVPTFEEARPQLEETARGEADTAAQELVAEVRAGVDVTVNPRFGTVEEGAIVPADDGVVELLEDAGGSASAAAGD